MTRKRFIKLLMATGRPRNDAARIAEVVPMFGWSYAQVYRAVFGPIAQWVAFAAELGAAMGVIRRAVQVPEEGGDG